MSLENIISFLISAECYNVFFLKYNLLHVGCLKLSVSKFLGYGIILGSLLVKVPQILKLWFKKSGEGISIFAQLLELYSVVVNAAYNWVNRFPFSSWGESLFMLLQTKIILTLVLFYGGMEKLAATFVLLSTGVIIILFSGILAIEILWLMQAVTVPVMFAGKIIQAYSNYKSKSMGQQSIVTSFLLFAGSVARIFTSFQETGDSTIILMYMLSTVANGIILYQFLIYNKTKTETATDKKTQ